MAAHWTHRLLNDTNRHFSTRSIELIHPYVCVHFLRFEIIYIYFPLSQSQTNHQSQAPKIRSPHRQKPAHVTIMSPAIIFIPRKTARHPLRILVLVRQPQDPDLAQTPVVYTCMQAYISAVLYIWAQKGCAGACQEKKGSESEETYKRSNVPRVKKAAATRDNNYVIKTAERAVSAVNKIRPDAPYFYAPRDTQSFIRRMKEKRRGSEEPPDAFYYYKSSGAISVVTGRPARKICTRDVYA